MGWYDRTCEECGKDYRPDRYSRARRFCSNACRDVWHNKRRKATVWNEAVGKCLDILDRSRGVHKITDRTRKKIAALLMKEKTS